MVPTVVLPPATPSTDHVTPPLLAVNCWVSFDVSVAVRGLTVIAAAVPMPVSEAVADVPAMPRVAVWVPGPVGLNVRFRVQLAPAPKLYPQLLVSPNDVAPVPEIVTPPTGSAAAPPLVSVATCGELVTLTVWPPKSTVAGVSVTFAPGRPVFMSDWTSAALRARL